jgi:hypothetical protein
MGEAARGAGGARNRGWPYPPKVPLWPNQFGGESLAPLEVSRCKHFTHDARTERSLHDEVSGEFGEVT